jgi:Peptidase inhibitor family I36
MTAAALDGKGTSLAATGIATLALTAPMLNAEPADAATYTKGACQANSLCEWSQGGFANNYAVWYTNYSAVPDYRDWIYNETGLDSEDSLNDTVSSVWNNTNRYAMLFRNNTYGSNRICFPPGTAVRDLHVVKLENGPIQLPGGGDSWGNRISSHRLYTYKPSDCSATGSTTVPDGQRGCSM